MSPRRADLSRGDGDLRQYFPQRRHRSIPRDKPLLSAPVTTDTIVQDMPAEGQGELPVASPVAAAAVAVEPPHSPPFLDRPLTRNPLYAAPPRIGDLVPEFDDRSEGSYCQDITHYLAKVGDHPQDVNRVEKEKLLALLSSREIAWNPPGRLLESSLGLRLLRKLIEQALREGESDEDMASLDLQRWLLSPGLPDGILAIVYILETASLQMPLTGMQSGAEKENQLNILWEVMMLIEPILKAEPLIGVDPRLATVLAQFERRLLAQHLWQGELIYVLLHRQDQLPRTRSRRNSISSPGKALRSMTRPVAAGVTPIEFFFRKFLRMAASVFEHALGRLHLDARIRQASWSLFMSGMEEEERLRMMHRRHVLTIVACTIYSVAKLFDEDKSFAEIISCLHMRFPEYGSSWFQHVFLGEEQGCRDIVAFYNDTYLGAMRESIYALRPATSSHHSTPEKAPLATGKLSSTPFPKVLGRVALARNITLEVSPGASLRGDVPPGTPICIKILGNLGARREMRSDEEHPEAASTSRPQKVARRLNF